MNMREQMSRTLRDSISEVLETMFFLCPQVIEEGEEGSEGAGSGEDFHVQIQSSNATPYRIVLGVPEGLARKMRENIIDTGGEEPARADLQDIACELANMVAGQFLSTLENDTRKRLSIPEVLANFTAEPDSWLEGRFDVEGETLRAYLHWQE